MDDKEIRMLYDHEDRIRKLEESDIKQQIQLANIEKSQSDIKLMINQNGTEQREMMKESMAEQRKITDKLLNTFTSNMQIDKDIKFYKTKEFWGIVAAFGSGIIAVLTILIKLL